MLFEHYGTAIGAFLIATVALGSLFLARKANRGVAEFDERQHERFTPGSKS